MDTSTNFKQFLRIRHGFAKRFADTTIFSANGKRRLIFDILCDTLMKADKAKEGKKMKKAQRGIMRVVTIFLIIVMTATTANAVWLLKPRIRESKSYEMSQEQQDELKKIYKKYNFSVGWGLYDISRNDVREVASHNKSKSFQSNCTIKAAMLLCICEMMDSRDLALDTKIKVDKSALHYGDFKKKNGEYSIEYLLTEMIHVSNNSCYEVLLQYVTKSGFNDFLSGLGSGTRIKSYKYMGDCTVSDRATEWVAIYRYCHSRARHASFAWGLLKDAKYSPIRDGIGRAAAHKSGWNYEEGAKGTAGDCAVVKTPNGGCYLMVMFTKNNKNGKYSQKLMRELAVRLDKVWDEYYDSTSDIFTRSAAF